MTPTRYSRSAMILHWLIAAALAFQFGVGEAFEDLPRGKALFDTMQFHKSIGLTILVLSLIRVAVRFGKPRPAPLGDSGWAERLASITHWGLYAFMILGPITGWLAVAASKFNIPTYLFGVIPWPDFPFVSGMEAAAKHSLHEFAEVAHGAIAKIGLLLFLLHVVGALRHQWLLKEPLIERMVPARQPFSRGVGSALIIALAAAAVGFLALGKQPGIAPAADAALMPKGPAAPPKAADSSAMMEHEHADDEAEGAAEQPAAEDPAKPEQPVADDKTSLVAPADPKAPVTAAGDAIPVGTAPAWTVASGGRLGFTAAWNDTAIDGRFARWSGDIKFNPAALGNSKISVSIDLASVGSGDEARDEMLRGADFFGIAAHPKALWTSSAISHLGGNRYRADGTLSLHGTSQPVPLTFTLDIKGKQATATGGAAITRTSFGVGQGDYASTAEIKDQVKIAFAFRATRS